ncbi:hypothetical protein M413DRAFT_29384 [Hebeloma cylindrosporum]|uniref:Uncharacterized protein n=1 Tax=Hebeloma cylindrosporum TaxID=76867 RepID=A0A0C2XNG3_HEBCY|nr:hypothetical protein M413DRAFT_29384 [Hebeloma cylindrosporum h7]
MAPSNLQLRLKDDFAPLHANNIFRLLTTIEHWQSMSIELDLNLAQGFVSHCSKNEHRTWPEYLCRDPTSKLFTPPLPLGRKWSRKPGSCLPPPARLGHALSKDITLFTPYLLDECIMRCVSAPKVRLYGRAPHYYPRQRKPIFTMTSSPHVSYPYQHLKLMTVSEDGACYNLTILRNFLERSKCPLRSVTIKGTFSDSILTDYLLFPQFAQFPRSGL